MHSVSLDFETFSEADIKTSGAHTYAMHPSTEVLCLAYSVDGGPPQLWLPGQPVPPAFSSPAAIFRAHNAQFERLIWRYVLEPRGWPACPPLSRWRCTMAAAAYRALPLSLDELSAALLPEEHRKDKRGKELIRKLCVPRKPTKADPSTRNRDPGLLFELYEYCLQDVVAEQAVHRITGDLPAAEQEVWELDQEINDAGVPVDLQLIRAAKKIAEDAAARYDAEMTRLTGGAVKSCTQAAALAQFCGIESVAKVELEAALAEHLAPAQRAALELRKLAGRSSVAKLDKLLSWAPGGRARGMLQYHGATTGRWAGRGPQPQNMPRPKAGFDLVDLVKTGDLEAVEMVTGDPLEAVASCLRGVFATDGRTELLWADFAAIEARVVLWLAEQEDALDIFRRKECIYCEMASSVHGYPVVKGMPERQDGKTIILGCGFGMGPAKFQVTANSQGADITLEQAEQRVKGYRQRFPMVPALWKGLEDAARKAILNRGTAYSYGRVRYKHHAEKPWLLCQLPTGRVLHYFDPTLEEPDEEWKKPQITYSAVKQIEGGPKRWGRVRSYGGLLTENCVQALARDCVVYALRKLRERGVKIILTVHDEIVLEVRPGEITPHEVEAIMSLPPPGMEGCPLAAEASRGARYGK